MEAHGLESPSFSTPATLSSHRKRATERAGAGYMGAEKDHQGEFGVLRMVVGRARSPAPTDPERECPELSAAEFRRFLKPASETDPTTRAHGRVRIARALLALVLLALVGLAVFLAGGRKEEGAARAAELARLQHEICRSAVRFAHRTPDELERLCPPSR
jgi:hypothetical protein